MAKRAATSHENRLPRQTPEASARDTARLEALLASIGEGIIATNEKGVISRINQTALQLLDLQPSQALDKRIMEVVVPIHDNGMPLDVFERPVAKAFQTGKSVSTRLLYRRPDGSTLPVQVNVAPVISQGKPIGAIEVFRDLTIEIENDKLKSDFISIASHQLRTPLSAINMYTRMMQDGLAGELTAQQKPYIQTILTSVERMNTLINTLLNITRIEAGGIVVKQQLVKVDDMAREILAEFNPAAQAKSISLTADIPPRIKPANIDSLLVREICANLLSNAIKYTTEGGKVVFQLTDTHRELIWSVTDTGYGIPPDDQKNIFLKFFRASNILDKDVSGTGLGLYLIKNIAESLGGDLWFESIENIGTTFYFSLPKEV